MTLMDVEIRAEDFLPESRAISNSEVTTFLSCKEMYNFAFLLNLAPKIEKRQITRGTLGHGWFEHYIIARLSGASHEDSMRAASSWLAHQIREGAESDIIAEVNMLCNRYMQYHQGWPDWELLGTEQRLDLELSDTLTLPIRYDLFVRHKPTGRQLIGDFKFTYDFWSADDHRLNPQMPKYISVMRANGYQVDGGFLEEIRTRRIVAKDKLAEPEKHLWKRTKYDPSIANLRNTLRQHVAASLDIERHRALDPKTRADETVPIRNKYGPCKYCAFTDLCVSKIEGKTDLSVDIRVGYIENAYAQGYNSNGTGQEFDF